MNNRGKEEEPIKEGRTDESKSQSEKSPLASLNLQSLLLNEKEPREFVGKDNKARHAKDAKKDQHYPDYDLQVVINEMLGHFLYSLLVDTPKTYVTKAENGDLQIQSEKKLGVQTLNQYLSKALGRQDPGAEIVDADFDAGTKTLTDLEEAINKLEGIGVLCFMALLLQDSDVFGRKLDNVLVNDKTVSKIDTSEISFDVSDEEFKAGMVALFKNKSYIEDKKMPFFTKIFNLLDEKQRQEGVNAISSLQDSDLGNAVELIVNTLGIDKNMEEPIYKTLRARRNEILINVEGKYLQKSTPVDLKDIKQEVIVRPASDFKEQKEKGRIKGGNSNPAIYKKVESEQEAKLNLMLGAKSIIKSMILLLNQKANSLDKGDKKDLLNGAVKSFQDLFAKINNKFFKDDEKNKNDDEKNKKVSRADLSDVIIKFNQIIDKQVYPVLDKNDRKKFSSAIINKLFTNKITTAKDEIEQLKQFLNVKYQGFFQSIKPPVAQINTNANERATNMNKKTKS